jgi:Holliday junction resolvase RusA-like endonuclease
MTFLPEIPTKGLKKSDLDDLIKRTYDIMNAEYLKLNEEVQARDEGRL